ncbi:hypothetical protein FALCPG4_017993 [Fusarium falciforme]
MTTNDLPELLYHTVLTVIDYYQEPSGPTSSVYVLGTHSTIEAAKAFATSALQGLSYEPEGFAEYAVCSSKPWEHGDGVLVFARAPAGQVFLVRIDTTLNNESLLANPDGTIVLPQGCDTLHYVLQTTIDYNLPIASDSPILIINPYSLALQSAHRSLRLLFLPILVVLVTALLAFSSCQC